MSLHFIHPQSRRLGLHKSRLSAQAIKCIFIEKWYKYFSRHINLSPKAVIKRQKVF